MSYRGVTEGTSHVVSLTELLQVNNYEIVCYYGACRSVSVTTLPTCQTSLAWECMTSSPLKTEPGTT